MAYLNIVLVIIFLIAIAVFAEIDKGDEEIIQE